MGCNGLPGVIPRTPAHSSLHHLRTYSERAQILLSFAKTSSTQNRVICHSRIFKYDRKFSQESSTDAEIHRRSKRSTGSLWRGIVSGSHIYIKNGDNPTRLPWHEIGIRQPDRSDRAPSEPWLEAQARGRACRHGTRSRDPKCGLFVCPPCSASINQQLGARNFGFLFADSCVSRALG